MKASRKKQKLGLINYENVRVASKKILNKLPFPSTFLDHTNISSFCIHVCVFI